MVLYMMREIKSRFQIEDGDDYGGRKEGRMIDDESDGNEHGGEV